ncbi:hypothetical protein HYG77_25110 [Rhodococcus sp. ZPP]|nr:hypothetical protein HYG77_25110 [Rhodococcus sp. ZPP]
MLSTPDAVRGDNTQQVGTIMKLMKTKTKVEVAAAVGAGYLLGRTHQLKMAMKIAGAGGQSPKGPENLLAQGSEFLASSPVIAELGDSVRGDLLDTTAATAEATSEHADSFRDRLRSRGSHVVAGGGHLVTGVKRIGRRGHANPRDAEDSTVDEEPDHGKDEDGQFDAPTNAEPVTPARRATRGRSSTGTTSSHAVQEEQQPKPRKRRKPRIATPSDSAEESRDESAPKARPDTTAHRKGRGKAHKPPTDVRDEEKPHNATTGEDETRPQPSSGWAHLRRMTHIRSTIREQSPSTATTPKGDR